SGLWIIVSIEQESAVGGPIQRNLRRCRSEQGFFIAGSCGRLSVKVEDTLAVRVEDNLTAVRRPNRPAVDSRFERKPTQITASQLENPDVLVSIKLFCDCQTASIGRHRRIEIT